MRDNHNHFSNWARLLFKKWKAGERDNIRLKKLIILITLCKKQSKDKKT